MAITGSGTQADPYIVHSYSEIRTVLDRAGSTGYKFNPYLELANDIDCNEYGAGFVWQTLQSGNASYPFTFDLGGFAIKNMAVGSNKNLFAGAYSIAKNGKLLNVFCTGCTNLIDSIKLKDMSMSINAMNCLFDIFATKLGGGTAYTPLENCSIYVENNKTPIVGTQGWTATLTLKNCDFLVKTGDLTSNLIQASYLNDCRIRGEVKSYYSSALISGQLNTCVVDVDVKTPMTSGKYLFTSVAGTTVYNKDYIAQSGQYLGVGLDSNKIKNGAELRNVGFPVTNQVTNVVGG